MPFFFNIFLTIFLASGFFSFGKFISSLFKLENILKKISNPSFQYALVGISFFLFLIYPSFFLIKFNKFSFQFISYLLVILGICNIYINFSFLKKFLNNLFSSIKDKNYFFLFTFTFLLFYFFYSLAPITSADSVAYHTTVAKDLIKHGSFPFHSYDFGSLLSGSGELLNAFAISIGAFQFTSFIHFLGLISVVNLIINFSKKNNVTLNNRCLLILLVISCPVLLFLIGSSKPQFFYVCCIVLSYGLLINVKNLKKKKETIKSFFLSLIISIISVQAKISFTISLFLIIIGYLYILKNSYFNFKIILLGFIIISISFLPTYIWKEKIFNYSFYHFFFNPLPLNIPGISDFYLRAKQYDSNNFPLSLFFPTSISSITTNLGIGCFVIYFLIKEKFINKIFFIFCILFFIIIFSLVGQKSPRFYLEIYLLSILLFTFVINRLKNNLLFKLFKILIYLQSLYVLILLTFGTLVLFPGSLTKQLNHIILSENSYGYNLYSWVNNVLPPQSIVLTNHRGYFYSNVEVIYADFIFDVPYQNIKARKYLLDQIKNKKPQYILFYNFKGNYNYLSYNFKNCIDSLYIKKEEVGFFESRNPFNRVKEKYNGYIFVIDYKKLPGCVTQN